MVILFVKMSKIEIDFQRGKNKHFFNISGSEAVWVRKINESAKIRIFLTQLAKGKYTLKRRAV